MHSHAIPIPVPDVDALRAHFPVMTETITDYFSSGRTSDDLYRDIVRLILGLPPQAGAPDGVPHTDDSGLLEN